MNMIGVQLTPRELALILEALDSHAYWQISERHQRNNGFVTYKLNDKNAKELAAVDELTSKLVPLVHA